MIIKNLSRSAAPGASGQLVRYIFKYIFSKDQGISQRKVEDRDKPFYVAGVKLTKQDLVYLRAEAVDSKIMADIKAKGLQQNHIAYIQKYLLQPGQVQEKADRPFIIRHNMRGRSLDGFIREFEANEQGRVHKRANQTSIHHTILSFSNKDSGLVTDAILRDISRYYIQLRGEHNLYCGTVHEDRDHTHLHIAMSATRTDGYSSRISKKEFEEVKIKLQEYQLQKYPHLSNSLPEHGTKGKARERGEFENIKRNERSTVKNDVLGYLDEAYKRATSTEDFIARLREKNIETYQRGGKVTGIIANEIKFRFSRLGVDLEALKAIGQEREKNEKQLKEIQGLRNGRRQVRELAVKEPEAMAIEINAPLKEEKDLSVLHELRQGSKDREQDDDREYKQGRQSDNPEEQDEDIDSAEDENSDPEYEEDSQDLSDDLEDGGAV